MEAGPPPSAREGRDEQKKARRLLARMERLEETAAEREQAVERGDERARREAESDQLRFAVLYRRLVGVHPAQREVLYERLEAIRQLGHERIEDVITELSRSPQAKRSAGSGSPLGNPEALPDDSESPFA